MNQIELFPTKVGTYYNGGTSFLYTLPNGTELYTKEQLLAYGNARAPAKDPIGWYDPVEGCVFADGMFEPMEVRKRSLPLFLS